MYGLSQAGQIANYFLTKNIAPHGFYQCSRLPGLWMHRWRLVIFSLMVDDFGVKYFGRKHVENPYYMHQKLLSSISILD